jgi:hypothetical protein
MRKPGFSLAREYIEVTTGHGENGKHASGVAADPIDQL